MKRKYTLKGFPNSARASMIDENVHSEAGRHALKRVFIDGKKLYEVAQEMDMEYSTFTDKYYNTWLKELFYDFNPVK